MITCTVCWTEKSADDMGNLTDRNGHGWRICGDCVSWLWANRRPELADPVPGTDSPVIDDGTRERAIMTLAGIAGGMQEWIRQLRDIPAIPRHIVTGMEAALREARAVYTP